jgi:RHS repeat-associated protein
VYDALGRRVKRTVGSSSYEYIYDNDGHIGWELLNGSINRTYIRSNGNLVAEYSQGATYFIHQDHLGSTRLVTGYPTPTVVECDDYYAYGEANVNVGSCLTTTNTTYKFTGDERDAETNLDHTQFRQNSSTLGRWMTTDPAGLAAVDPNNPQSWNRYEYALDSPLSLVDPFGLDSCPEELRGDCGPGSTGGSGPTGYDPVDTSNSGGHDQTGGGSSGGGGGAGANSRIQCATQFGQSHSLAAGVGAVFGDKVGNNFVTQLFLGNTVSSVAKIGTDIFGGTTPTGRQVAAMALKGAGQGIPIPNAGPGVRGFVGPTRNAIVGVGVGAGYNAIVGVGQETLELGLTTAKVATVAAPLASTTLQTAAAAITWGKIAFDGATFLYGLGVACRAQTQNSVPPHS